MQKLLYALPVVLLGVLILVIVVYKDVLWQDQSTAPTDTTPTVATAPEATQPPRPTPEPNPVLRFQPKLVTSGSQKVLELWMAPVGTGLSMRNLEIRIHISSTAGNLTAGELELNQELSEGNWNMPIAQVINEETGSVTVNLAAFGSGTQGNFAIANATLLAKVPLIFTGDSVTVTIDPVTQVGSNDFKAMTFEQTGEPLTVTVQ
jgi:hypothetical protein